MKTLFTVALNKRIAIAASRDETIEGMADDADVPFDTTTLETGRASLLNEMNVLSEKMQGAIRENARGALDQTEHQKKYDELADRYTAVKRKHGDNLRKALSSGFHTVRQCCWANSA